MFRGHIHHESCHSRLIILLTSSLLFKIGVLRRSSPQGMRLLESTGDSNVNIGRPKMDHIVSCYKGNHLRRKPTSENLGLTYRTLEQNPARHQDFVSSTAAHPSLESSGVVPGPQMNIGLDH